ncbi:NAD(P)/FAD-dependent oxidoreductase [Nocardia sp. NPDC005998]|uniref:FAD-dependent oxidoreductase n=1 Tax=Nocardia sp. NPDC005998 TaxID=3156894 RepID=UPI0033A463D0
MRHALIIGGGLAGATTALALRKAGLESTIFEAHAESAEGVGGFLTVAVNGQHALNALGCGHVLEGGFDTPRMALYSGTGKRLAAFDYGPSLPNGVVACTISRPVLYGALRREALEAGIEIVHGKRLVEAEPGSAGVTAHFADGTDAHGDLLIGADGLRSRTRTVIDAAAPAARYTGLLNTGGYARGLSLDAAPGVLTFVFGRRGFFGYVVHPDNTVWWFANLTAPDEPAATELSTMDIRARLNATFAHDRSPALDIVSHSPDMTTPFGTYDFPTVPTWHRDAMVIVGDAAHAASPSAGQGASMAFEDAVVLARALRDRPSIPGAFAAYEHQRRERVERVVAWGKKAGDGKAPGLFRRLLRDHVVFPLFVSRGADRTTADPQAWMYEFPFTWDTGRPDYDRTE